MYSFILSRERGIGGIISRVRLEVVVFREVYFLGFWWIWFCFEGKERGRG